MKKELLSEENGILLFSDETWVDLSQIEKVSSRYMWNKSVNSTINFYALNNYHEYVDGSFKIVDYLLDKGKRKVVVIYNDNQYTLLTNSILNANLLVLLSKEFKYSKGDEVFVNHSALKIIDTKKENYKKYYKYICKTCGYSDWKQEINFKETVDSGCPCCSTPIRKVVKGINDIYTTDDWMVKYFKNKNDAYKYASCSNENAHLVCPDCGIEKYQKIYSLKYNGFACECKTNGFSYPEKFIAEMLRQLNITYISQYNSRYCSWTEKYLYDFYLPDYNIIIETHGKQHYDNINIWQVSFEEEIENDAIKKSLALKNGIYKYIELDCQRSVLSYIKNSVMLSILPQILNFKENDIDWNLCNEKSTSNIVKNVCEFYEINKYKMLIIDMAKKFGISRDSIRNYLLRGNELGWCHYKSDGKTIAPRKFPKIKVLKDDKVIGTYNSAREIEKISKDEFGVLLQSNTISRCASGSYVTSTYKGYSFEYEKVS